MGRQVKTVEITVNHEDKPFITLFDLMSLTDLNQWEYTLPENFELLEGIDYTQLPVTYCDDKLLKMKIPIIECEKSYKIKIAREMAYTEQAIRDLELELEELCD